MGGFITLRAMVTGGDCLSVEDEGAKSSASLSHYIALAGRDPFKDLEIVFLASQDGR